MTCQASIDQLHNGPLPSWKNLVYKEHYCASGAAGNQSVHHSSGNYAAISRTTDRGLDGVEFKVLYHNGIGILEILH